MITHGRHHGTDDRHTAMEMQFRTVLTGEGSGSRQPYRERLVELLASAGVSHQPKGELSRPRHLANQAAKKGTAIRSGDADH